MKEKNEKKQIAIMWVATILIIILIAIIVGLYVKVVQLKKETQIVVQQQFEQMNQQEISGQTETNKQQKIADVDLNKSFEERTKEARDILNQGGDLGFRNLSYISLEHFASNASIEKKDDYYLMKLKISSSKLYDKEDVENAYNLAKENGIYTFDGYTLYKDNNYPIDSEWKNNDYVYNQIEAHKKDGFLAKNSSGSLVKFMIAPNTPNKYCVAYISFATVSGFVVTETEKELEVILLPTDKIKVIINHNENNISNLSVEELYNKALNGDSIEVYGYDDAGKYDLLNLGNSRDSYAGYQNAVEFNENELIINYTVGGV